MSLRTKKSTRPQRAPLVPKAEISQARIVEQAESSGLAMDEASPHLGDWFAFYVWVACFTLLLAMNAHDLLRALFNW